MATKKAQTKPTPGRKAPQGKVAPAKKAAPARMTPSKRVPAKGTKAKPRTITPAAKSPRGGRPTKFSEALVNRLLEELTKGKSLRSACELKGMPVVTTVLRWLSDPSKPGFCIQYARACEARAELLTDEIISLADDVSTASSENIAKARLQIDARKWYASKLAPKKYGDKLAVGGTEDLPPVQVQTQMSDAETAVHLAKILASAGANLSDLLKKP